VVLGLVQVVLELGCISDVWRLVVDVGGYAVLQRYLSKSCNIFQEIFSNLSCLFDDMSWFGACHVVGGRFCNCSWRPGACMMEETMSQ